LPFRYRGSRRESAVAQLFSLGGLHTIDNLEAQSTTMKNISQTLFTLSLICSVFAFICGISAFNHSDTWPGAMLAGISLVALLGTGVAVKLLYFRDE
jgi:drug/metabolite transporter (DMT)-like permease